MLSHRPSNIDELTEALSRRFTKLFPTMGIERCRIAVKRFVEFARDEGFDIVKQSESSWPPHLNRGPFP